MKKLRSAAKIAVVLLGVMILCAPSLARESALRALKVCAYSVIPSILPFMVITELLFCMGDVKLPRAISLPIKILLGIPEVLCSAFVVGLVGGFPAGAIAVGKLYERGLCSKKAAEYTLSLANNPSPAFVICVAGETILGSVKAGALLLAIELASLIPASLVLRYTQNELSEDGVCKVSPHAESEPPLARAIALSVRSAGQNAVSISAFIVFFGVTSAVLLSDRQGAIVAVLSGMLEMVSGMTRLSCVSSVHCILALCVILGFGGVCVICQVAYIADRYGLSVKAFVFARILLSFFSFLLGLFALSFLPFAIPTAGVASQSVSHSDSLSSRLLVYSLCVTTALVILACKKAKKSKAKRKFSFFLE